MDKFSDGIHGFLFVYNISNPRFTKEEEGAFKMMKEVCLISNTQLDFK